MPYKGDVQLLPDVKRHASFSSYASGNGYFYAAVSIIIGVIIVGAIMASYKASLNDQISKLDGQLQETEDQRSKDQEKMLLDAARQSLLMKSLLSSKIYWSQALANIEQMMQPQVRLLTFDANLTRQAISFRAAADNYSSVAKQLAAFNLGNGINDISITSLELTNQGGVEFSGEMLIDSRVMLNKNKK